MKMRIGEPGHERQKARRERLDKLVVLSSKLGKPKNNINIRPVQVKSYNCDHLPLERETKEEKMKRIITTSLKSI